jgi:PAS domain-containing protein
LGVALFTRNPYWLLAVEVIFLVSLVVGVGLTRSLFQNLGFARAGIQLIQDQDFTSRIREVGQPEIDELIGLYNRMVDNLRDERTRLQEQHHFLSHILRVSPSGIVILDFDGLIATVNPAAERLLGLRTADLVGRKAVDLGTPLGAALATLPANETHVLALGGARRVKCHHGTFIDRGFPRSFLLIEELTEELRQAERGAYEKLIRVMAHEVNNTVAASNSLLHSSLTYGAELSDASRPDFEQAIGIVRGCIQVAAADEAAGANCQASGRQRPIAERKARCRWHHLALGSGRPRGIRSDRSRTNGPGCSECAAKRSRSSRR